jgi:SAM-dependent methyltransferase
MAIRQSRWITSRQQHRRDEHMHNLPPSRWVQRFAPLIPRDGSVLDVACGHGRHARMLAAKGYRVTAVDRDAAAVATLAGLAQVSVAIADLEGAPWPYAKATFAGVVVTHYLHRPRFQALIDSLHENGVLIYETFMSGNAALGRPTQPEFLLQPGELLERVRGQLTVIAFEQGRVEQPKPACVQRICAVAGTAGVLPDAALIAIPPAAP